MNSIPLMKKDYKKNIGEYFFLDRGITHSNLIYLFIYFVFHLPH